MPKRLRLTRRFPVALTNDAYRSLTRFSDDAGLSPDEALTFLFEHLGSVVDHDTLAHRLRLFKAGLEERRA